MFFIALFIALQVTEVLLVHFSPKFPLNKKSLSLITKGFFCGADGARTRDLLRDRQAL